MMGNTENSGFQYILFIFLAIIFILRKTFQPFEFEECLSPKTIRKFFLSICTVKISIF